MVSVDLGAFYIKLGLALVGEWPGRMWGFASPGVEEEKRKAREGEV